MMFDWGEDNIRMYVSKVEKDMLSVVDGGKSESKTELCFEKFIMG